MERRAFCAGVDIGGTKLSGALFSATGRPVGRRKTALDPRGGEAAARQVADIILELEDEARRRSGRLLAAGLCVPGIAYQRTGRV
jgi:glucokinase